MKYLLTTFFAFLFYSNGFSQTTKYYNTNGIAIKGYDVVAYFLQNQAVEGKDNFSFEWSGSKWRFSSQSNLDSFKVNPAKYAPQYGGYCAYGCSENHKSPTEPNAFTIVDSKLYLNYNLKVKELWVKDAANRIKTANTNWISLNN
jgi:YHS domain-containing protein